MENGCVTTQILVSVKLRSGLARHGLIIFGDKSRHAIRKKFKKSRKINTFKSISALLGIFLNQ